MVVNTYMEHGTWTWHGCYSFSVLKFIHVVGKMVWNGEGRTYSVKFERRHRNVGHSFVDAQNRDTVVPYQLDDGCLYLMGTKFLLTITWADWAAWGAWGRRN